MATDMSTMDEHLEGPGGKMQRRMVTVDVYDGRSWPVVASGEITVGETDTTKELTKRFLAENSDAGYKERRKRSSKYTFAVGSSFGHVHAFLKDSDLVLSALDQHVAEDQCLMLIKKPKSAAKHMLKAHSWANLAGPDPVYQQNEGQHRGDPQRPYKHRGKRKPSDLSLPPGFTAFQKLTNHMTQTKELSSVEEQEDTTPVNHVPSWRTGITTNSNLPNSKTAGQRLSHPYPFTSMSLERHIDRRPSSSNRTTTVRTASQNNSVVPNIEINNNQKPVHVPRIVTSGKNVPQSNLPQNHQFYDDRVNGNVQHCSNSPGQYSHKMEPSRYLNNSSQNKQPDSLGEPPRYRSQNDRRAAHGINNDNSVYVDRKDSNGNFSGQIARGDNCRTYTALPNFQRNGIPNIRPHTDRVTNNFHDTGNQNRDAAMLNGRQQSDIVKKVNMDVRCSLEHVPRNSGAAAKRTRSNCDVNSGRIRNDELYETGFRPKFEADCRTKNVPKSSNKGTAKDSVNSGLKAFHSVQQKHAEASNRVESKMSEKRKRGDDVGQEKEEPVSRSHSMGDLSSGLTFSLVGQRKADSMQSLPAEIVLEQESQSDRTKRLKQNGGTANSEAQGQHVARAGNSMLPFHYGSLQSLSNCHQKPPASHSTPKTILIEQNTQSRPRRTLPQIPADADERKKKYTDLMKMRLTLSSRNSSSSQNSSSLTLSDGSVRQDGGISATPSDREVSELLDGANLDNQGPQMSPDLFVCNIGNKGSKMKQNILHPIENTKQTPVSASVRSSDSFGSQDHSVSGYSGAPSGGRFSETGQTTLTSQCTVDSGYITNDAESDTISTSNYAKSLKQSAQNLYTSNKLFKSPQYTKVCTEGSSKLCTPVESSLEHGNSVSVSHRTAGSENKSFNTLPRTRNSFQGHEGKRTTEVVQNNVDEKHPNQLNLSKSLNLPQGFEDSGFQECHASESNLKIYGKASSVSCGLDRIHHTSEWCQKVSGLTTWASQPKFSRSMKDLMSSANDTDKHAILKLESQGQGHAGQVEGQSTLPGSWKFLGSSHQAGSSVKSLGKPSLFQLLQNYQLYPVHLKFPKSVSIVDHMRLLECEVVFPSPWTDKQETNQTTNLKGSYARLGGPGSAFKPVKAGSSSISTVTMVTIVGLSSQITDFFGSGQISKGDLIVEVNEKLVIGEDLRSLKAAMLSHSGEMILTLARDQARTTALTSKAPSSPSDTEVHQLEDKISKLSIELKKKDRTLQQLNALLPWKQSASSGQGENHEENDSYIANLSEDEYIV